MTDDYVNLEGVFVRSGDKSVEGVKVEPWTTASELRHLITERDTLIYQDGIWMCGLQDCEYVAEMVEGERFVKRLDGKFVDATIRNCISCGFQLEWMCGVAWIRKISKFDYEKVKLYGLQTLLG